MPSILVIDDDRSVRYFVGEALRAPGWAIAGAETAQEGRQQIAAHRPDLVLLDIMLPDGSGIDFYREIQRIDARLPIVFITACDGSNTAIEAMMCGAFDYLLKPLEIDRVRQVARLALESRRQACVHINSATDQGVILLGQSRQMTEVFKAIGHVAATDVAVLIRGESGTGKELVARALHRHGTRAQAPFLAVNCAAIPETLLESELFGHEKGSFTGAERQRTGKFEQCSGGTIFLDEVGDMSPPMQAKLLRVLQEQRFERVGGNTTIETDVRIIAATHRDLEAISKTGGFRADLYWRLNGFAIHLPPLRERGHDLLLLLEDVLSRCSEQLGRYVEGIAPDALQRLTDYSWPGNVRELQGAIRHALLQMTGPVITVESLPEEIRSFKPVAGRNGTLESLATEGWIDGRLHAGATNVYDDVVRTMELQLLQRVLNFTGGNQSRAALILGITRGSLRTKIERVGLRRNGIAQLPADRKKPRPSGRSAAMMSK